MNLILLTESDAIGADRFVVRDERAEHIRSVLKATTGDTVEIGLVNGPTGRARLVKCSADWVELVLEEQWEAPAVEPEVTLICALPRPQTLKKVLSTAASMGVSNLHFIRANRVEKSFFQSTLLEPENYRPFLLEGLSQGKLTHLPQVTLHRRFRPFFEDVWPDIRGRAGDKITALVTDPAAQLAIASAAVAADRPIALVIGPEGGWVPFELDLMSEQGFEPVSLGRWLMRVEVAVAAALAQVELVLNVRR
jgi:RsmE family RNA methyltransferase